MADELDPPPIAALLVDDDVTVRQVASRMLARTGVEAVAAESGEQAIELLSAQPNGFAVVMLDLNMPSMSGESTLTRLRSVRPDIPVLFVSGDHQPALSEPRLGFLQKPFSIASLRAALATLGIFDD